MVNCKTLRGLAEYAKRMDQLEPAARALYEQYTANHPTIHCNRFPSWNELTQDGQDEWFKKAQDAHT